MPKKAAAPILKGLKKSSCFFAKANFQKWPPPVLPFTKGKRQSGFCFSKGDAQEKTIQKPWFLHFNPGFPKCLGRNPGFSLHLELRIFKVRFS